MRRRRQQRSSPINLISRRSRIAPVGRSKLTPRGLAKLWGIGAGKVLSWIATGELRAINVATREDRRPRYLIDVVDIMAFEKRRTVAKPASSEPAHM